MPYIEIPARNLSDGGGSDYAQLTGGADALATIGDGNHGRLRWNDGGDSGQFEPVMITTVPVNYAAVFAATTLPAPYTYADVTAVTLYGVAYRSGGGTGDFPNANGGGHSTTYPDLRIQFNGDGTFGEGRSVDPFPVGGYAAAESDLPTDWAQYVLTDHPLFPGGDWDGLECAVKTGPTAVTGSGPHYVTVDYLAMRLYYGSDVPGVSTHAPPCVLYPRDDSLGPSTGHIFPPPRHDQARNGLGLSY